MVIIQEIIPQVYLTCTEISLGKLLTCLVYFQERPALCKCLCGLNVTAEDMLEAILYVVESKKKLGFEDDLALTTTTTTPRPIVGWRWSGLRFSKLYCHSFLLDTAKIVEFYLWRISSLRRNGWSYGKKIKICLTTLLVGRFNWTIYLKGNFR